MMGSLQLSKAADRLDTNAYQRASFPSVPPPLTKSYIRTRRTINIYWHPLPLSHRQTDRQTHTHTLFPSFPLSLFLYFPLAHLLFTSMSISTSHPLALFLTLTSVVYSPPTALFNSDLRHSNQTPPHRWQNPLLCSALLGSASSLLFFFFYLFFVLYFDHLNIGLCHSIGRIYGVWV